MTAARWALLCALGCFGFSLLSSCSLTVDLDHLDNRECGSGAKLCADRCVGVGNPQTGCAADGCVPCVLPSATANCGRNGRCAIAACLGTHADCNRIAEDGCEIDVDHDPQHCGGCTAAPCVVSNAVPDCAAGRCAVRSCRAGFGDCNELAVDGCETDVLTDSDHCSECELGCLDGTTCQDGQCV